MSIITIYVNPLSGNGFVSTLNESPYHLLLSYIENNILIPSFITLKELVIIIEGISSLFFISFSCKHRHFSSSKPQWSTVQSSFAESLSNVMHILIFVLVLSYWSWCVCHISWYNISPLYIYFFHFIILTQRPILMVHFISALPWNTGWKTRECGWLVPLAPWLWLLAIWHWCINSDA